MHALPSPHTHSLTPTPLVLGAPYPPYDTLALTTSLSPPRRLTLTTHVRARQAAATSVVLVTWFVLYFSHCLLFPHTIRLRPFVHTTTVPLTHSYALPPPRSHRNDDNDDDAAVSSPPPWPRPHIDDDDDMVAPPVPPK
ncbi:hypothetical protein L210DRAFT_3761914 [Boletus edulis BED1]|uniref:Uncharacterized protein n=1 Tax=Boletus edulis BED1 TaxID=1328754 RepID=A0AAD4BQG1_BOLED|nr:hypothetical protein L210DRAFT_3761914 [Boletus edulis BED1]